MAGLRPDDGDPFRGGMADALRRGLNDTFATLMPLVDGSIAVRDGYRVLICRSLPIPPVCGVWIDDPSKDEQIAAALPEAVAEVEAAGVPCTLQVINDTCPRTVEQAATLGLTEQELIVGMVVQPDELRAPPPTGEQIRTVDDPRDLQRVLAVTAQGFGVPEAAIAPIYTDRTLAHPDLAYYLAEIGDQPVSAGVGFHNGGLVGVYSIATPPDHRRHGYGSAIVSQIVSDAAKHGASLAYLQASPMGASVYRKLGFQPVIDFTWLTRPT